MPRILYRRFSPCCSLASRPRRCAPTTPWRARWRSSRSTGSCASAPPACATARCCTSSTPPGRNSRRGRIPQRARHLLAAVQGVESEGLRPADYHLAALLAAPPDEPAGAPGMELLRSDALIRLAAHHVGGKLDPLSVEAEIDLHSPELGAAAIALLAAAVASGDIAGALQRLAPQSDLYQGLKRGLAEVPRHRRRAAAGPNPRRSHAAPGRTLAAGGAAAPAPARQRRPGGGHGRRSAVLRSPRWRPRCATSRRATCSRRTPPWASARWPRPT
jgi:hypothetical protein